MAVSTMHTPIPGPPNRKRNCRAADRAQRLQRDAARGIREGAHASEARCSQAGRFAGQAGGVVAAGVRRIVLWVSAGAPAAENVSHHCRKSP
jgi:hypothetical protein